MTAPRFIEEPNCWRVAGVRSAEKFFRAVPGLAPEATHLFLEGSPDADVAALLSSHVDQAEFGAPVGTIWSWPRSQRFSLRASSKLFDGLSVAGTRHAEPEICDHLHLYRNDEPLVHWFDAFGDPVLISKAIPRQRVERFCSEVGGVLSDCAAAKEPEPPETGLLFLLRTVGLIAVAVAAFTSVGLMLRAGRHTPRLLLAVFVVWVLSPFVALAWVNMLSKYWSGPGRVALFVGTLVIALGSMALYGGFVSPPAGSAPAFVWVAVPPASWLFLAFFVPVATLILRWLSRRGKNGSAP